MRHSGTLLNAVICCIKDRAEFPRMLQEQPLQFVVQRERESLQQLQQQLITVETTLTNLQQPAVGA